MMIKIASEMRLFDGGGNRLYLNEDERQRFLEAANEESREHRVFCHLLHYTGCRITEGLELIPRRIDIRNKEIVFRTLKKRKTDNEGRIKQPHFRPVPVPGRLIDDIDLVFDLRKLKRKNDKHLDKPLWGMSRPTAWRMIKRVMARANIDGPMATSKGLRHGFGIALAQKKLPPTAIRDLLGHTDTQTTEIYTKLMGQELREMVATVW